MSKRALSFVLAAAALTFAVAPAAIAADLTDVGYLDQAALASLPMFNIANGELQQYKGALNAQFMQQMKSAKTDADKQRLAMQFQQEFNDKQREILGPLLGRAQAAIADVAAQKKLAVVLDKRIVIYGGVDISNQVISMVRSTQAIAAPQSTPPPSEIGFVDESALDSSQKVRDANASFGQFEQDQRTQAAQKFKNARSNAEKQQIAADYQKTIADKQEQLLKPLVDQTKTVTASIAKSKNLILVVDRADIVFGGTDITSDVQNALGK